MEDITAPRPTASPEARANDRGMVAEGVILALSTLLSCPAASLHEDTRLFDDLGLDSSTALEVLLELEDKFEIKFDPETLEYHHFESVGSLTEYVISQSESH
ncbi:MAG TPA: acyl carrier protein [Streptosporangiaceae bacterium]